MNRSSASNPDTWLTKTGEEANHDLKKIPTSLKKTSKQSSGEPQDLMERI